MQVVTCSLPLSLSCNCPIIFIQQHKIRFSPYFHEQIDLCLLMGTTLSKRLSGLVLFSSTDPFKFCDLVFRLLLEANMYKHLLHASLSLLPLTIPCQAHFFLRFLLTITATLVVPLGVIFSVPYLWRPVSFVSSCIMMIFTLQCLFYLSPSRELELLTRSKQVKLFFYRENVQHSYLYMVGTHVVHGMTDQLHTFSRCFQCTYIDIFKIKSALYTLHHFM